MRFWKLFVLLALLSVFIAACGGTSDKNQPPVIDESIVGVAARGEKLYKQTVIGAGSAPGCVTCHSLAEGVVLAGPSHAAVGLATESAVPGTSAEAYLRESLINPDAHIVDGFTSGVMYANYAKELSGQEIADLVAFMLSLR